MISLSHLAASIRKETEVQVFGEHVLLNVFTPGKSGGFGCCMCRFEYLYQKLKPNYTISTVNNSNCEQETWKPT